MASQRQLSFLSRGPLFDERAREIYITQKRAEGIPELGRRAQALREWSDAVTLARRAKEGSLETDFYKRILGEVLGYVTFPNVNATAYVKPPKALTGIAKVPDAVLGPDLTTSGWNPVAVLELKAPDTDLDAPQARESHLTPVEQAFEYAESIPGIRWVLISDMRWVRLYSVESRYEFLEFDLAQCARDAGATAEFLQLYFLLGYDYLVRDNCHSLNNPGAKAKGGGSQSTSCKQCGLELQESAVEELHLVSEIKPSGAAARFIDGDDLPGRYKAAVPSRWVRLDTGFKLKPGATFKCPKILLRQAGVGVAATLDATDARCPQSVYLYRPNAEHALWGCEYVLAVLLARAFAYFVFKRFGEVDPARPHAKLTHERLATSPIPRLDLANGQQARLHGQITADVRNMLDGTAKIGAAEDWRIELAMRELYGLSPEDGAYINAELKSLPPSQAQGELFPEP